MSADTGVPGTIVDATAQTALHPNVEFLGL